MLRKVTALLRDQERVRENLKALRDSREDRDLRMKYLDQLTKQEDDVQGLRMQMEQINAGSSAARSRLNDLIADLSWAG